MAFSLGVPSLAQPICIIVTTFNRRDITERFLESLATETRKGRIKNRIYIVDDASTDGTKGMIESQYPEVVLLSGNGQLYWAGGVRLALDVIGSEISSFKGILLVNDDVVLAAGSISRVIALSESQNAIVGGTVMTSTGDVESSGSVLGKFCKPKPRLRIANGSPQSCDLMPGHLLYIPIEIFQTLNGFDPKLPYRFIDLEFTLRARRAGLPVLLAPDVVAFTDEVHDYYKETSSMRGTFRQLINRILLHPKGPHWRESAYYLRKVSPLLWWLWLPFFYRAFFVAVFKSYFERIPFVRKNPKTPLHS
jgi:GT2 family glycosyltransferase